VDVLWSDETRRELRREYLACGFRVGETVVHTKLGMGLVLSLRELAGFEQVLVEFSSRSDPSWIPAEELALVQSVEERFDTLEQQLPHESAERFRLRVLAHFLEHWHQREGRFVSLGIDPLPHQLHLVHTILSSGNLNWLIADDVGLGKTIELGLLLTALFERPHFRRVLIVTPAGLALQWKEELIDRFHLEGFRIEGIDFTVTRPAEWRQYERVIISLDRLKREPRLSELVQASRWDLVVFDEAHHLSRRQVGLQYRANQRFEAAAELRESCDNIILLTATPHKGDDAQFKALLELLRPQEFGGSSDVAPERLAQCVFRNRKLSVTDAEGRFIFRGHDTTALEIPASEQDAAFNGRLMDYLRNGYQAAERLGPKGRAIGFVMTIFRKLAASSASAILRALEGRLSRLDSASAGGSDGDDAVLLGQLACVEDDERFAGESLERCLDHQRRSEFFEQERKQLEALIELARARVGNDGKLAALTRALEAGAMRERKVLIFSEYRSTQEAIAQRLREVFGADCVAMLHGGLKAHERREVARRFGQDETADSVRFLVSTEAGGEGINLQRRCHTVINFDLPWSPMRLVQRIGRVYRYGQRERVQVLNFIGRGSFDERLLEHLYNRLLRIDNTLGGLSDEYSVDQLSSQILGDLAALVEVEEILEQALLRTEVRAQEEIERALELARETRALQEKLLAMAQHFEPSAEPSALALGADYLKAFVLGCFRALGCETREPSAGNTFEVRLNAEAARLCRRNEHRLLRCGFDASALSEHVEFLHGGHELVKALRQWACASVEQGLAVCSPRVQGVVAVYLLGWQNRLGELLREELLLLGADGAAVEVNPGTLAATLLTPWINGARPVPRAVRAEAKRQLELRVVAQLQAGCRGEVVPAWARLLGAAAASQED
jgi:superfamily II DNA or RNA helicase